MVIGFIEGYRAAQSEMSDGKPWLCLPKGIGGQAIIDAVIEDLRSPGQKQDVHAGKALHGALVRAFPCPYCRQRAPTDHMALVDTEPQRGDGIVRVSNLDARSGPRMPRLLRHRRLVDRSRRS